MHKPAAADDRKSPQIDQMEGAGSPSTLSQWYNDVEEVEQVLPSDIK
jgi:hypothetical protein